MYVYNVKQQIFRREYAGLSSNGLEISLDVSVLYQPKYDELGLLHKTKGENYVNVVLIPQIRAVARRVDANARTVVFTKRDAYKMKSTMKQKERRIATHSTQCRSCSWCNLTYRHQRSDWAQLRQEQEALDMSSVLKRQTRSERQRMMLKESYCQPYFKCILDR